MLQQVPCLSRRVIRMCRAHEVKSVPLTVGLQGAFVAASDLNYGHQDYCYYPSSFCSRLLVQLKVERLRPASRLS